MVKPIVIMDGTSFHYYRVTATRAWCKKTGNTDSIKRYLIPHYFGCLKKFAKAIGYPDLDASDIIFTRDCPRDKIWRNKFYPSYKSNRDTGSSINDPLSTGSLIKELNTHCIKYYKQCIRLDNAEADDVVAVLVKHYLVTTSNNIVVVSCDSDLSQLICDRVTVWNPRGGWKEAYPISLRDKIRRGDRSDNVPPAGTSDDQMRLNRLLIDLSYVPISIQDAVLKSIESSRARPVQLGLVCLNTELRKSRIFCSRKPIIRTMEEKGIEYWKTQCIANCNDLLTLLKWNLKNNIYVMRISSGLFPHYSNTRISYHKEMNLDFARDKLIEIAEFARNNKMRLTFHPGQYNVVGTPHEDVFANTIRDLDYHAEVLDIMGCPPDSTMVVHGGGLYGDKPKTKARWIANFSRLPKRVQRRLVLENCEKCFNLEDCIEVSQATGVPVVYDTHHYHCYNKLHPDEHAEPVEHYLPAIVKSWTDRGMKPLFHISEQRPGSKTGAHSDLVDVIPDYFFKLSETVDIDIMIEAKLKEQAINRLYQRYPQLISGTSGAIISAKPKRRKIILTKRPQRLIIRKKIVIRKRPITHT